MEPRRPTLRDVAARAGLSPSAVSLALRSHPSIPQRTRHRVERIASELDYRPDPALNALRIYRKDLKPSQNRSTIAVIENWPQKGLTRWNPASKMVFQGTVARAEKLGYSVESFWMRDFKSHRKASDVLYSRGVKGLIVEALPHGLGHLGLQWERFCTVSYCFDLVSPQFHRVIFNDFDHMTTLRRKLVRLGYKRPGFIFDKRNERASRYLALAAHVLWESRHKSPRKPIPILSIGSNDEYIREIVPWLRTFHPDVIVGTNSGNLQVLLDKGIRVPKEVAFVSRELFETETSITGFKANHRNIGAVAVDLLHSMIIRGEYGVPEIPQTILIPNEWNEGTTAPKKEPTRSRASLET